MESRLCSVLLAAALLSGCGWFHRGDKKPVQVSAEDPGAEPTIVEPQVTRREVKTPKIKAKDFEMGAYFGALSIEDFGTNPLYGIRAAYHVTEDFFLEGFLARAKAGQEQPRRGFPGDHGAQQLWEAVHVLRFGRGLQHPAGEVFLGEGTGLQYGALRHGRHGRREIRRSGQFALNFGVGTRILITDWLALHLDVRDHVFESSLFGVDKNVHNIEGTVGLTTFF